MQDTEKLAKQYNLGIKKTACKSNILDKLNCLREVLNLQPRDEALKNNEYDKQCVDTLKQIDFSPLDINNLWAAMLGHNKCAFGVLNIAGSGLLPAIDVPELDIAGQDSYVAI